MSRTETLTLKPLPSQRDAGLFGRVAGAVRSYWTGEYSLKDPELNRIFGAGSRSKSGVIVNEFTMFTCAAVYDAINQISSDVAKLPLSLKKRRSDGGADDYVASKTFKLLKHSPNPETRTMVFRQTITKDALVGKGGFAEIERDTLSRPAALWYIESHRVQPFYDTGAIGPDGRKDPLRYRVDGEEVFEAKDILHLHGLSPDGVVGFEMVQVAREAIGLALASQQFAAAFFGNGTRFGGVLSSDQDLDDDQKKEIRETIDALHAKADKAFRLLILGAGFKFTEAGVKPNEAQMKEIRDQQVMEIARFFNMPLHKLKLAIPGAVSYASVEMADLDYYKGCLLNWITLWEQELDAKLISPLELGSQYFKHNAKAFLRGDTAARTAFYSAMLDRGVYHADAVLDLEDENPQPDGLGKLYLVQGAQVPKNQLSDVIAAKIEKDKQKSKPVPPPASPPPADDDSARAIRQQIEALTSAIAEAASTQAAALVALESASGAERTRLQAEADSARQQELLMTAEVATLRVDLTRAQFDAATAERERQSAMTRADAAEVARAEALALVEQSERDVAEAQVRRDDAESAAERARAVEAEAVARATAAAARADAATSDRATMEAARDEALTAAAEARSSAATAAAAQSTAESALVQALANAEEARAEAIRVQELAAADATARAQADADATAARAEKETAATELAAKHGHLRATESERDQAAADAEALRQQLEVEKRRSQAVVAAHRGLMLDAVARMTRREVQHARSKMQTPEKFRKWLTTFAELDEAVCVENFLPAIRAQLAWLQSDLDPAEVTSTFVREHLQTFTAQAQRALDADPNDFHAVLESMLTRWETERPIAVADAFLTQMLTGEQP